jgi:glycosyltransferase involved in cell wall biosynthesis
MTKDSLVQIKRRYNQVRNIWLEGGSRALLDRVRRTAAARIAPHTLPLGVRSADVLAADFANPKAQTSPPLGPRQPMIINWVTTPPAFGSGGHTTMFRLIEHLERSGCRCRVYIYDVYGGDSTYFRPFVKELFPRFKGSVDDVSKGMADAHAVVATSWPTAYPVYNDPCQGKRFYLVQDFEPWFYPLGGQSALAENTYRMGFHAITAGQFLANKLRADYGMTADAFEFGCDTARYHLLDTIPKRDSIVFYAKPDTPRRAFELGAMALQLFAERRPDLTIHLYGSKVSHLPFRYVDHGVLRPEELNKIYNRCFAGLSLSMTNVSLVPHEMLSAGCIPVVNDATHNRMVLNNSFVRYACPTPHSLATALVEISNTKDFATLAASASASVASMLWLEAGSVAERSIRTALEDQDVRKRAV